MKRIIIAAAVAAAVPAIVKRYTVLEVTGESMLPTLEDGDVVLCRKSRKVGRGDVIAFEHEGRLMIKRVIGISGDTIEIGSGGEVYRNGVKLDEPYVMCHTRGECSIGLPCRVGQGELFVMGDNRAVSIDSRSFGYILSDKVTGRVCV